MPVLEEKTNGNGSGHNGWTRGMDSCHSSKLTLKNGIENVGSIPDINPRITGGCAFGVHR
jgi:hypothetical protein